MADLIEKRKYHLFSEDGLYDGGYEYHGSFYTLESALVIAKLHKMCSGAEIWENSDDGTLIETYRLALDSPGPHRTLPPGHDWNRRWEKVVVADG